MCTALANSRKSQDRLSFDARDHQNLCLLFANTLVHEIAHVFITYLSKGQDAASPGLIPTLPGIVPLCGGESSQPKEEKVFGGKSSFWRYQIAKDCEGSVSELTASLVQRQHLEISADIETRNSYIPGPTRTAIVNPSRKQSRRLSRKVGNIQSADSYTPIRTSTNANFS